MGLVIQSARPNHFSKELLKYIFMKLDFRSKVMIKTSVCWVATFSVEGTYILKMEFIIS